MEDAPLYQDRRTHLGNPGFNIFRSDGRRRERMKWLAEACGPNGTPRRRKLPCDPFRIAAGGPVGGFETM